MLKILIVDDDKAILDLMTGILVREGYHVVSVSDGHKAIDLTQGGRFDLIITDLVMPGKEGLETIMDLRRHNRQARIIAMSGCGPGGPDDYLSLARKFGAKLTLAKPFSGSELLDTVAQALRE